MVYALDTNIIIRYLRNELMVTKNFHDAIRRDDNLVVPQVVHYEIARGFRVSHVPKKEAMYGFLIQPEGWCDIAEMDKLSWERAEQIYAELYHKRITIGEIDILIGASCLAHGYTLVTNNTRHFERIDGLSIVDWTEA